GERIVAINLKEEPEPLICKFCNKELKYKKLDGAFNFYQSPNRCNCKEAQEYWDIYDKKIAEIEKECEEIEKKERRRLEVNKLETSSHLGRRFKNRTFNNFERNSDNENALEIALDFAFNFEKYAEGGKGLLFTGTVGTGKTHLAASIANYLIKEK